MLLGDFPIGISGVVLCLGYFNFAFSIKEFVKKNNQPIWKKLWKCVQNEPEDVCRMLLLSWALFPNILSTQSLRILWVIILTELLYRRFKKNLAFINGGVDDICHILLMGVTLHPSICSLHDIWVVWIVALMEIIYRRIRIKLPLLKEFVQNVYPAFPGRRQGSSHEGSKTDEKNSFLEELKCSMCCMIMLPPITMCENGHNICKNCKSKLDKCPECRGDLVDIRNIALEKMAETLSSNT